MSKVTLTELEARHLIFEFDNSDTRRRDHLLRDHLFAVADVLSAADRVLDSHGWLKGKFGNEAEGFCAIGAVNKAHHDLGAAARDRGFGEYVAEMMLEQAIGTNPVVTWNDQPKRRKRDVQRKMRRGARRARRLAKAFNENRWTLPQQ